MGCTQSKDAEDTTAARRSRDLQRALEQVGAPRAREKHIPGIPAAADVGLSHLPLLLPLSVFCFLRIILHDCSGLRPPAFNIQVKSLSSVSPFYLLRGLSHVSSPFQTASPTAHHDFSTPHARADPSLPSVAKN